MLTKRLYIEKYDFAITFMFDVVPQDVVAVMLEMEKLRFPYSQMKSVRQTIEQNSVNWGLTSIFRELRNIVVLIGEQTSLTEAVNSIFHETLHVSNLISQETNLRIDQEPIAYLTGELSSHLTDIIVEYVNHYGACKTAL